MALRFQKVKIMCLKLMMLIIIHCTILVFTGKIMHTFETLLKN